MIHAGISELRTGFRRNNQEALQPPECRRLLLFYAVECGLKAVLLRDRKLTKTSQLDSDVVSHDLMYLAKTLKLPAAISGKAPQFRVRGETDRRESKGAHEAWRYGIAIEAEDDVALEIWLKDLWKWAEENIR